MSHFIQQQNKLGNHIMKTKQHGFSLIEFMVASAISMIVLLAAGSTYFTTMKLKQETQAKVGNQQDMRNAGDLIRRDLRQAGDFGCLSAPPDDKTIGLFGGSFDHKSYISTTKPDGFPTDITIASGTGNVLVIIYGDKEAQSNPKCGDVTKPENVTAVAYVVGKTAMDTKDNLYRLVSSTSTTSTGTTSRSWTAAQMVAENVTNMNNQFKYVKKTGVTCPKTPGQTLDMSTALTDDKSDALSDLELPILATTTLKTSIPDPTSSTPGATKSYDYVMDTMVQQGNICLKQTLEAGS